MMSRKTFNERSTLGILILIGAIVLIYSTIKAFLIPLTWDEIYTFEYYVKKGVIILSTYNYIDANNHLLNTWLMELFYKVFGGKEIVLRLPNLIAQLLFIIYSGKFAMRLSTRVLAVTAFLILNLNPYIGDYFILARGYGLSIGLMMMSLYFAYKFINENDSFKSAFLSVFIASLALLANFTLLNYVLLLPILLIIINYFKTVLNKAVDKDNLITNHKVSKLLFIINSCVLLVPLSVLFIVLPILNHLRKAEALIAGGDDGFWVNTVVPLIKKSFNNTPIVVDGIILFEIIVALILLLSFLLILLKWRKDNRIFTHSFFVFVFVIISLCSLANILQHKFFGILFLKDRTAIIYIPMFSLLFIYLIKNSYHYFKKTTNVLCLVLCLVMIGNFIHGMSLTRVIHHTWDHDLCDMVDYLKQHHKEIPAYKQNLSIGADRVFEEDLNNYRNIYYLTWLNRVEADNATNPLNDYFYISKENLKTFDKDSYIILKEFPKTKMVLMENIKHWNHRELFCKNMDTQTSDSISYSYTIDDTLIANKRAIFNIKVISYLEHLNHDASFMITFERDNKRYAKHIVPINDFWTNQKVWTPVYLSVIVPDDIRNGDVIKAYIIDNKKNPIKVQSMEVRIVTYF